MLEDYRAALRSGQRAYRACVAQGKTPFLEVLDEELMGVDIVAQEPLGLVDIPAESIVGTKTSGRHTAFAANFMPLLDEDTEFASKWSHLCDAHLEEGIHTPIIAFEYLNRFYVQEGNKRVSVLKYYGAVKIPGTVTRLVPAAPMSCKIGSIMSFWIFISCPKVNALQFSRPGSYAKLQTLVCKASEESWTEDDRRNFAAFYAKFSQQFYVLGGGSLDLTLGMRCWCICRSTAMQMPAIARLPRSMRTWQSFGRRSRSLPNPRRWSCRWSRSRAAGSRCWQS